MIHDGTYNVEFVGRAYKRLNGECFRCVVPILRQIECFTKGLRGLLIDSAVKGRPHPGLDLSSQLDPDHIITRLQVNSRVRSTTPFAKSKLLRTWTSLIQIAVWEIRSGFSIFACSL